MPVNIHRLPIPFVHDDALNEENDLFLSRLSEALGYELGNADVTHLQEGEPLYVFVPSGGTENEFKKIFSGIAGPVFLITTGQANSLAASMEILSFIKKMGGRGEILHGSHEALARRINMLERVMKTKSRLAKGRLGAVGMPSDWLIASEADYASVKEATGLTLVDISMEELLEEIDKATYPETPLVRELLDKHYFAKDMTTSLNIYGALKRLVEKYELDGFTLRCFDLLDKVHGTGCLALGILNSEGIFAGCEGDMPALVSMMVLGTLSEKPVFQANPSRFSDDREQVILAHCSVPFGMIDSYRLTTHYESGIGVGIDGEIPRGEITIFKASATLDRYFVEKAAIVKNLHEGNLCRTQIEVACPTCYDFFMNRPIGNHQLIVVGDFKETVEEFFKWVP
ncbi:MAG: hypothetical protein AVO33_02755 [delta proteobacterium ML8_F1]|nr:MAG: hypothetical protein AVO33_02755 [delta proteobacterium ML8_F1]